MRLTGRRVIEYAEVTDERIEALRVEAGEAGDAVMVAICERALHASGPERHRAREQVADALRAAAAMAD